jgi:hypothetical protein
MSPISMSPGPSSSPLSSPYNLNLPHAGHFDFNKSHLL